MNAYFRKRKMETKKEKPLNTYLPWLETEDDFLQRHYKTTPTHIIAEKLERTPQGVRNRAAFLGLTRKRAGRAWKTTEIAFLREHYTLHGAKWCAREMGRSVFSIYKCAPRIGVAVALRKWTEKDDDTLRKLWLDEFGTERIADVLGRSAYSVKSRAATIGLPRRDRYATARIRRENALARRRA